MRPEPGSPEEWLEFARSDLALSRCADTPGVLLEPLCFLAQQAAEKSIKAVLIQHAVEFPKIHSIARLLDLLPAGLPRPPEAIPAAELTRYAVNFRYPHGEEPITERKYAEAVRLAEGVVTWAEGLIHGRRA
jgi:HEPN domain-containing protein